MANAVYRSSSSTRKSRDYERPRGNARLASVESEARAMPLERPEETQGQKNVSDKTSPPELLTDTPDFTTESRTFLPSDKDNSPTEHAARTRNSSGEEARDKTCVRPRSRNIRQGEHKKEAPSQEGGRDWPLRLTPSLVLMFVVFELVTLSFFFLFGLIIGKGTVPPSPQAELERILPAEENRTEQAQEILPQEELRFMANLKADDSAAERQQNGTTSAPAQQEPAKRSETSILADDSNLYDFVIRVAAFKNEDQADALRARLEGAGMRTRLQREKAQKGTWSFVQVLFRGTEVKMTQLRDTLPSFGLRDSIIVSKTPVQPR